MRLSLTALLLLVLAGIAAPQGRGNLFTSTKPDVSIVVRTLATGADSVEISMVEPNYPPELLASQIAKVGEALGQNPSAVRIERNEIDQKANLVYLQGLFAVKGLVDKQSGILRVEPFAKAFAGGPADHQTNVLMIRFDEVRPTQQTLRAYNPEKGTVRLQGVALTNPTGVEYRVQLLTQDPAKISIPDARKEESTAPKTNPANNSGPDGVLIGCLVAAALAAGALVYSALTRSRSKDPRARRA